MYGIENRSRVEGLAARLPMLPDRHVPDPESRRRQWLIRSVSILALLVTVGYLTWRTGFTIDLSYWWVAVPLLVLEFHNGLGLLMFTFALWDVDVHPRKPGTLPTGLRVAVLIATYDEPEEVLLPTIAAAIDLDPVHETWVLDDGRRAEVEHLAAELGARYLTRPDNRHAKAGNINHALEHIDADVIAVLDADHVAHPDFLRSTLPYFNDAEVALVQTPQDFYNVDSFEHEGRGRTQVFNEQAIFYRVIAAGKNRWDGAFWCGTCALVRLDALREVGGVATDTVTEDIHTTVRMHRRGWKTVYHNEVLARGLAARSLDEYLLQRHRWATGAMQVIRTENPITVRGLSFGQRLSYATTLWAWFDSWRSLGYIVLPMLALLTAAVPINAPAEVFGPAFLGTLALQFFAMRLMARGYYPPILSILFEFLRMPAVLAGTLALFRGKAQPFRVTPKGRHDERLRQPLPRLYFVLIAGSIAAVTWFGLGIAGLTPVRYENAAAMSGIAFFLVANSLMLAAAARRIRSPRFGGERRAGARLDVLLSGTINDTPCELLDVSLTGARLVTRSALWLASQPVRLTIEIGAQLVEIDGVIRRIDTTEFDRADLGIEFAPNQQKALAKLAVGLLSSEGETENGRPAPLSHAADRAVAAVRSPA